MANRQDYAYRRLVNVLGPDRVRRGALETFVYSHDVAAIPKAASLQFKLEPDFVALPRTTEEVVRLVRYQAESQLPIVPRGGGTGLYGGAVPNRGGILVDFRRMNRIIKIDAEARTMMVEPGVTWLEAYERAWEAGLFLPVYPLFARGSTVGGWIASGGVGIGSFRYGASRDLVVNLEVVQEDGTVVQTGREGLDLGRSRTNLNRLYWGSEGTLGLITRATLRLRPRPEEIRTAAYAVRSLDAAGPMLRALAASPVPPYHVALLDASHLEFLKAVHLDGPEPATFVTVTFEGPKDEVAEGERIADEASRGVDGAKASAEVAKALWDGRLYPYPTRRIGRGLVICEGIVPRSRLSDALARTRALQESMKMEVAIHAALADPNSVLVTAYFLDDETNPLPPARLGFVVRFREIVADVDGHAMGLGLFLAFDVATMHGNAYRYFRPVKEALDPNARFNAGKMHEIRMRFGFPGLRRVPLMLAAVPFKVLGRLKALPGMPRDRFVQKYEAKRRRR